jgi:hypothetical protein
MNRHMAVQGDFSLRVVHHRTGWESRAGEPYVRLVALQVKGRHARQRERTERPPQLRPSSTATRSGTLSRARGRGPGAPSVSGGAASARRGSLWRLLAARARDAAIFARKYACRVEDEAVEEEP